MVNLVQNSKPRKYIASLLEDNYEIRHMSHGEVYVIEHYNGGFFRRHTNKILFSIDDKNGVIFKVFGRSNLNLVKNIAEQIEKTTNIQIQYTLEDENNRLAFYAGGMGD